MTHVAKQAGASSNRPVGALRREGMSRNASELLEASKRNDESGQPAREGEASMGAQTDQRKTIHS